MAPIFFFCGQLSGTIESPNLLSLMIYKLNSLRIRSRADKKDHFTTISPFIMIQ